MKRILALFLIGFAVSAIAFSFDAIISLYMMENGFFESNRLAVSLFSAYGVVFGMLIVFGIRAGVILSLAIGVYAAYYVLDRPKDLQTGFLLLSLPWAVMSFYAFTHNLLLLISGFHLPHGL